MNRIKSIIALSIIVLIPFGLVLWIRDHQSTGFASLELIAYPLLFGGLGIAILILTKKYFLNEELADFNSGESSWKNDIIWGLVLTIVYFVLFYLERLTLSNLLQFNSNMELLGLMLDMRDNPMLVLIWFGPVLWIGVALYEELIRVFILTQLWKWFKGILWAMVVVFISAVIIGLAHWNQGPYGMVTVGIKSLVAGYFFWRKRRFMPLVYSHALYDGIQVAVLLLIYPDQ